MTIAARCFVCGGEFTEEEIAGAKACPGCGSERPPMSPDEDMSLSINWFELRILANWAARHFDTVDDPDGGLDRGFSRLLDKLRKQAREGWAGLTFGDEIEQLRDAGFSPTIHERPPDG